MGKIKLGFSTGCFFEYDLPLEEKVKFISDLETEAIELGFVAKERLKEEISDKALALARKFKYRSIHAPGRSVTYPSKEADWIVKQLLLIAKKIKADTVLFHPDRVKDFDWLNKTFGSLVSFENMDSQKSFGGSIEDLRLVFERSPQAKWVFDLNHLYTLNPSMNQVEAYYKQFKDRLCHYHLSSHDTWHTLFTLTPKKAILNGVTNFDVPIIHEAGNKAMRELIKGEYDYLLEKLEN